jgi:hypothetical protein
MGFAKSSTHLADPFVAIDRRDCGGAQRPRLNQANPSLFFEHDLSENRIPLFRIML